MYRNTLIMLIMGTGVDVLRKINDSMAVDIDMKTRKLKAIRVEELVISIISEMNISIDQTTWIRMSYTHTNHNILLTVRR